MSSRTERQRCSEYIKIDPKYHLMTESYETARQLFAQGRRNYELLKHRSLKAIDLFLDAVLLVNEEMATVVRDAMIRLHKLDEIKGFDDKVMAADKLVEIADHCLMEPAEKAHEIRPQFHELIKNFYDVRTFAPVGRCARSLPDEVAATHCVLHQAVLFNETMQENLLTIVEIKTRRFAKEMNETLFAVQSCLQTFIPNFYKQSMLWEYTRESGAMVVLNAVVGDILKNRWRNEDSKFLEKWSPVVAGLNVRNPKEYSVLQTSPASPIANFTIHLPLDDFDYQPK